MNYIPPQHKIMFDVKKIADALCITPEQAIKEFKDGRVVSRFSEYWTSRIYGFKKVGNSNNEGYDGIIKVPLLGTFYVGVRSLTKSGIKFQKSKFIGSKRRCTNNNLIESINDIDFEIVVDIIDFPTIILSPVDKNKLLELIYNEELTSGGLKREQFYGKIFNNTVDKLNLKYFNLYK